MHISDHLSEGPIGVTASDMFGDFEATDGDMAVTQSFHFTGNDFEYIKIVPQNNTNRDFFKGGESTLLVGQEEPIRINHSNSGEIHNLNNPEPIFTGLDESGEMIEPAYQPSIEGLEDLMRTVSE